METGATTCGTSTASAHGTTAGSRGDPPDAARRRGARDIPRRVRWLGPAAGCTTTTSTTSKTSRRRHDLEDRLVVDAGPRQQARVLWHTEGAGSEPTELSGLFSSNSVWNRPDVGTAQLGNQRLAQELTQEADSEIRAGTGPWIETSESSTPVYVVGAASAACRCISMSRRRTARVSESAFERVPLPADARPAAGSDAHLTLIQPSTDSMWEFWRLRRDGESGMPRGAAPSTTSRPARVTTPQTSWPGAQLLLGRDAPRACPSWLGR